MRSAAFIFLLTVSACLVAEAKVDAVHKPHQPDKREGIEREIYLGNFEKCSFNLEYTLEGGRIVRKKWGDYFFGLGLGYSPKNGGWNKWDFLQVYAQTKAGVVNVLERSRPVLFLGYSSGGSDILAAEWLTDEGKRLRLRFVSAPSHPEWLFLRVDFSELKVRDIVLSAYPGNAAAAEGRERHFATRERDWNLAAEGADLAPQFPAILLYSRFKDDRFGNKLVYDAASVARVTCGKASTLVSVRFTPKADAKTADFALGYFAHRDPSDQVVRFLGEDADTIHAFLRAIDWQAVPDRADFQQSVRIALKLGIDTKVLNAIAARYLAAAKRGDVETVAGCFAEVEALRREKVRSGLSAFAR